MLMKPSTTMLGKSTSRMLGNRSMPHRSAARPTIFPGSWLNCYRCTRYLCIAFIKS